MNDTINYLKRLRMFEGLTEETITFLAGNIKIYKLAKGEMLIKQGDPSDMLFVIRNGWVKVTISGAEEKETVMNQFGPGQVIGEVAMIDRKPRSANVVAISPIQVYAIKYDDFTATIEQSPKFAIAYIADLSDRLRFTNLYLRKAIEWSQRIAAGNYDDVQNEIQTTQATIIDMSQANEIRIGAFLSAMFKMIKDVKKREDNLKEQLKVHLKIEIDESKREQDVENLAERSFFFRAQTVAEQLRKRRNKRYQEKDEQE